MAGFLIFRALTRYSLDEINDALHASAEKRDLSGVIVPNR